MRGTAYIKHLRVSPKKVKPVLDQIRGKRVSEAEAILKLHRKRKIAPMVLQVLEAAKASYYDKVRHTGAMGVSEDDLVVRVAKVDRGSIWKRIRPAWRGRAVLIRRRRSHIRIEVEPKEA